MLFLEILPVILASLAGIAGGGLALFWNESDRWRSYLLHFAAGLLLGVIAVDLLPEVRSSGEPLWVIWAFLLGSLLVLAMRYLTESLEAKSEKEDLPHGLVVAAVVDTGIDGLIIGAGFAASGELGTLLSIVLGMELFVLNLSIANEYIQRGAARRLAFGVACGVALMLLAGALAGYLLLHDLPDTQIANVLAFAAAALLYLATEELFSRGQSVRRSPMSTAVFFLGFLALMAFTLLGPG
jgi:zinc transporter, ZIP family